MAPAHVWLAFFLLSGVAVADGSSHAPRQMAITVDDLPVSLGSRHSPEQWIVITRDLLATLKNHGVPAVGFVNEERVETGGQVDPAKVAVLEQWLQASLELGNHSYSHPDLHKVPVDEWLADVARGERLLRPLMTEKGKTLRYFRHPFLHTGRSVEIQKQTTTWLTQHGYTVAPVTMDNSEWVYGRAYAGAYNEDDENLKKRIGDSYVQYMLDVVSFYEGQAQAIVGRPIPQILLIHAYALNADHLGTLLDRLQDRGYSFVSLADALEDPVFQRPTHGYTGMGGITWLHRWAITEGLDRSIFRGEPTVPSWVEEMR